MAGTGPKISNDPIELLTAVPDRPDPFINQFWTPMIFGGLAFISVCMGNWYSKRPVFSGVQKHLSATAVASYAGTYAEDYRRNYLAERDAILRHYVQLHPEDFPVQEKKKYSEVLEKWYPIR